MKIWSKQTTVLLEAEVPAPERTDSRPDRNRLLLLIPEGSLAFRLHEFPDVLAAQSFVNNIGELMPTAHWGAFWTHDSKPIDLDEGPAPAEVVVILRDESRPDIVQLFSFLDMEGAARYLRASVANGLDLGSVLTYWVTPVAIDAPPPAADGQNRSTEAGRSTTATRPGSHLHSSRQIAASPPKSAGADTSRDSNAPPEAHVVSPTHAGQPSLVVRVFHRLLNWEGWHGLPSLVMKAALLGNETLEGVRRDPYARGRAALVVLAGASSAGVGTAIEGGVAVGAVRLIATVVGWAACVVTIQIVGKRFFDCSGGSTARVPEAIGLASGPALLLVLAAVPVYGPLFVLCIFAWLLVAMTVAVQTSLELDRDSALVTGGVGWLLFFAVAVVAPVLLV